MKNKKDNEVFGIMEDFLSTASRSKFIIFTKNSNGNMNISELRNLLQYILHMFIKMETLELLLVGSGQMGFRLDDNGYLNFSIKTCNWLRLLADLSEAYNDLHLTKLFIPIPRTL
jgi:hypothetical protein